MTLKHKLYLFITPSWLSFIVGIIISLSFIGVSSYLFAEHSGRFGNFELGNYLQSSSVAQLGKLSINFLSSIRITSILFVVFWVILGFIIYNVIFALKSSVDESVGFLQELTYVNARPGIMSVQVIARFLFLLLALILWVVYALGFSWLVLPNSLNYISRSIIGSKSPAYMLLGFLLVLVSTQVAAIILRFTFLRARISSNGL